MEINDILVAHWGYEQTNVDFYKVLEVTKKTAIIQELETITIDEDMTGFIMPVDKLKGHPFRKKIQIINNEEFIRVNNYTRARKWNHKRQLYSSYN